MPRLATPGAALISIVGVLPRRPSRTPTSIAVDQRAVVAPGEDPQRPCAPRPPPARCSGRRRGPPRCPTRPAQVRCSAARRTSRAGTGRAGAWSRHVAANLAWSSRIAERRCPVNQVVSLQRAVPAHADVHMVGVRVRPAVRLPALVGVVRAPHLVVEDDVHDPEPAGHRVLVAVAVVGEEPAEQVVGERRAACRPAPSSRTRGPRSARSSRSPHARLMCRSCPGYAASTRFFSATAPGLSVGEQLSAPS